MNRGANELVNLKVSEAAAGTYRVNVGDISSSFTVENAAAPLVKTTARVQPWIIVIGFMAVGCLIWLIYALRKRVI